MSDGRVGQKVEGEVEYFDWQAPLTSKEKTWPYTESKKAGEIALIVIGAIILASSVAVGVLQLMKVFHFVQPPFHLVILSCGGALGTALFIVGVVRRAKALPTVEAFNEAQKRKMAQEGPSTIWRQLETMVAPHAKAYRLHSFTTSGGLEPHETDPLMVQNINEATQMGVLAAFDPNGNKTSQTVYMRYVATPSKESRGRVDVDEAADGAGAADR